MKKNNFCYNEICSKKIYSFYFDYKCHDKQFRVNCSQSVLNLSISRKITWCVIFKWLKIRMLNIQNIDCYM